MLSTSTNQQALCRRLPSAAERLAKRDEIGFDLCLRLYELRPYKTLYGMQTAYPIARGRFMRLCEQRWEKRPKARTVQPRVGLPDSHRRACVLRGNARFQALWRADHVEPKRQAIG